MRNGPTRSMFLKVVFCSAQIHEYTSVQSHEGLFQPFDSTSGILVINQVYLLKRSVT